MWYGYTTLPLLSDRFDQFVEGGIRTGTHADAFGKKQNRRRTQLGDSAATGKYIVVYVYIYICVCVCVCTYVYRYTNTYKYLDVDE